jgi:hypothetical protein
MPWERMTAACKPCPCGAGKVRIDITYRDTDWGMTDQSWEGIIECGTCAPRYALLGAGRGVDVVRIEKLRRNDLLHQADQLMNAAMSSPKVAVVIEQLAAELDALPTVAARYRLLVALGIESASLPTFRKHVRGVSMRNWLAWQFPTGGSASGSLKRLLPN